MLGLCFVLYEALDIFQGCYQHYHHSGDNASNSSLANIERHNKSVLSRANKIIKDIIVEDQEGEAEDELCLIDEEAVATAAAQNGSCHDLASNDETEADLSRFRSSRRFRQDEESMVVATIVPGAISGLMLLDNNASDAQLMSPERRLREGTPPPSSSSSVDVEMKRRLLLKMELLNEKSSLLRPHHRTTSSNNNNNTSIGDNESHLATNYICRNVDYEKLNNLNGDRFIDSSTSAAEFEQNANMIRVFSVSECVL